MLIDLANPDAVTWWQDRLIARITADGLAGFKCDRGEEKPPDGVFVKGAYADGTDYREGRNAFPYWYARAVQGAWERAGVAEYVNVFRSAWKGSQRHAIFWGGDTAAGEWGLRSAIIAVQRSAVMNFPIWGSDTCGYNGFVEHENCMRWLAFSAFTPLMEFGPTENSGPWSLPLDGADSTDVSLPVGWDRDLIAAWILYANLHEGLLPYTRDQAAKAHEDGTPIVRPMVFMHPDRADYRTLWTQYYYGPDLVVAPPWEDGTDRVTVKVPPTGEWIDAWTGNALAAGTTVTLDAAMHQVPILVRKGSGIDLGDLSAKWDAAVAKASVVPDLAAMAASVP